MKTEWILTAFPKISPIFECPIPTRYFIEYDKEYLLQWIQPPTSLLDVRVRARMWCPLRICHWDRNRIYWVDSYLRKTHACIKSTSDSTLTGHTHDLNWAHRYFTFEEPASSSPVWTMFLFFSFMKTLIRFLYVNQAEYWHAHSALFWDLFLKRSKYYTKHYYRESFGPKQDMQTLVGPALSALYSLHYLIFLPHD